MCGEGGNIGQHWPIKKKKIRRFDQPAPPDIEKPIFISENKLLAELAGGSKMTKMVLKWPPGESRVGS
jgi:hypothetical protein